MVRDDEIQRLVNYGKGLGLNITFSSKKSDCAAFWYLDNSGIVICKSKNVSKIDTVLSLIHELGHALHNIHERDRQIDRKVEDALNHVDKAEELKIDAKKRQRKIILNDEIAGTAYWDSIYKETNMKFPIWRLEVAKEYDMWQYQFWYETGKNPQKREKIEKYKEIEERYKNNV